MSQQRASALARGCWRGAQLAWVVGRWLAQIPLLAHANVQQRARWRQRQCARVCRVMRLHIRVAGSPPRHGLLVANHIGYVDVLTLGSLLPATFVSKAEVAHWPVIGPITRAAGTLYVQRGSMRSAAAVTRHMTALLTQEQPVLLFPEGTSSSGDSVLPFQSPLFEAALRSRMPVYTAAVRYQIAPADGCVSKQVAYWGEMTLGPHLFRLLCLPKIQVDVSFAAAPVAGTDRHALATAAEGAVAFLYRTAAIANDHCSSDVGENLPCIQEPFTQGCDGVGTF